MFSCHVRNVSALLTLVIDTGFNSGHNVFGELFEFFLCFGAVNALLISFVTAPGPRLIKWTYQNHVAVHVDWRSLSL